MILKLIRKYKKNDYTIGNLYIDNKYYCNTLEDTDRGLSSVMLESKIKNNKVYSSTAIPTGEYEIDLNTVSQKFKNRSWAKLYGGKLPRLLNVKGFEGILIHVGNTAKDSLGCILVGENTIKGKLTNSTNTFHNLMKRLIQASLNKESIIINIE